MQIRISTRHGQLSDETQTKITSKMEKLTRFFERLTDIEVTVDLEHRDNPSVDLKVSAEHKHDFVAASRTDNLMTAIDSVVEKMEQQLRKYKQKVQERHRSSGIRQQGVPNEPAPENP